ncbi:MAG: glycosyltransferase family 1 protein [Sandaracinus sp.]|nr:glycosyltransferase family 1 protein [Sandaracinus sp.]
MRFGLIGGDARYLARFRKQLLLAIRDRGHEVHAFAGAPVSDIEDELKSEGVTVHSFPLERRGVSPLGEVPTMASLARALTEARPDIVLSYTPKLAAYGTYAAALARVPRRYAMMSGLGTAFTVGTRSAVTLVAGGMLRGAFSLCRGVFFHNPDDRDTLRDRRVLPSTTEAIVVNGSGIDLDQYPERPLPEGRPTFLMVGRMHREKGVGELLDVAFESRGKLRIRLVGPLEAGSEIIERRLREAASRGFIEWPGSVADVRPELASCSVFVLPSYREGTPRSVLEAMATGRAVITTDAPGCRETVDGTNGILVAPRDAQALHDAMNRLAASPAKVRAMGTRSRTLAETKYDVHRVNSSMIAPMGL